MSLKLLVDEDSQAKALVSLLKAAGHDVKTVAEVGAMAHSDAAVLALARKEKRALLTRNAADFRELHNSAPDHYGILVVCQSSDLSKNMTYADIVKAISNVESSKLDMAGQFVVLNAWSH